MVFQEPKVEFVEVSIEDIIATSGGGAGVDVCTGGENNNCPTAASFL